MYTNTIIRQSKQKVKEKWSRMELAHLLGGGGAALGQPASEDLQEW